MREQRSAMEKELGGMQAKAQGSYQELQTMQIKVRALNYRNEFSVSNFVFLVQHSMLINMKEPRPFGILLKAAQRLNPVVVVVVV